MNQTIINTRVSDISDNRIGYYTLHPFKNHSKTHWRGRYEGSRMCKCQWFKKLCAVLWIYLGVKI